MNLQELQTLVHHGLPVKLFILNNQGYSSIEQTQRTFFDSRFIGCNLESGISFPDNAKLADLYGLPYYRIDCTAEMGGVIARVLRQEGAALCEVVLTPNYSFAPKLSSQKLPDGRIVSSPLEDLSPLLERGELKSNMIARETEAADV
jgi:acetolactate synthase-1/2/3 large subunit